MERHRNKWRGMVISTVTARRCGCVVPTFSKNVSMGIMLCRMTMLPTTAVGGGIWHSCANRSSKLLLLGGRQSIDKHRHATLLGVPVFAAGFDDQTIEEPAVLCRPCGSSCPFAALAAW